MLKKQIAKKLKVFFVPIFFCSFFLCLTRFAYCLDSEAVHSPLGFVTEEVFVYKEEASYLKLQKQKKISPSWPILDRDGIKAEVLKALEEKPLIN